MERIRIRGGRRLNGQIAIGGAKNAALPLMVASLLTEGTLTLTNLPHLVDITTLAHLLNQHGVTISMEGEGHQGAPHGRVLALTAQTITSTLAPHDIVRKMRASVLVLGPLVARCGQARVSLPGGDAIGLRPVDLHITGLQKMGAIVDLDEGYIEASAPNGLHGAEIIFPFASVGATENLMMAACLADGETNIYNAAKEPEVVDLADCLITMGAEISGAGTAQIRIRGRKTLNGGTHRVIADRIETGTYLIAAAMVGGDVELTETTRAPIAAVATLLEEAGVEITDTARGLRVRRGDRRPRGVDVMTEPFPGFPTDMQAQLMALMTVSEGAAMITETIFENRFMHVPELARMGANIKVHGASALVRGVPGLMGSSVSATDLRASVSLVLAGLAAEGDTFVDRIYHLDRGYERLEAKLAACGAEIERVKGGQRVSEVAPAGAPEEPRPLKLKAADDEDLAILSACLQDAIVLVADILYEPEAGRLALVADRFRWEAADEKSLDAVARGGQGFERVTTAVTICNVRSAKRRGFDPRAATKFLSLLAIRAEPGHPAVVRVDFSADCSIRLEVDRVQVFLQDMAEPRPTSWKPSHTL